MSPPCTDRSILKGGYVDDPGPAHLSPGVPLEVCVPYNAKTMLKYDNEPQHMEEAIHTPVPKTKKLPSQVKYSNDYVPPEMLVQEKQVEKRSMRIAEQRSEQRTANKTGWLPSRIGKLYTVATGLIDIMFLPTHIEAMATTEMIDYRTINFLFPGNDISAPIISTAPPEKLRAYFAALDQWNMHLDPMPEDEIGGLKRLFKVLIKYV